MGVYDLPAVVDYILNTTGEHKLYYIGHSMGTTMFYVLLSERPQYNSKIRAMFSLAPVSFTAHITSPLRDFVLTRGLDAVSVRHDSSNKRREGEVEQVHLDHSTAHLRAH
jgi:pimeloyl-ACP methyl ester carboxylesterase